MVPQPVTPGWRGGHAASALTPARGMAPSLFCWRARTLAIGVIMTNSGIGGREGSAHLLLQAHAPSPDNRPNKNMAWRACLYSNSLLVASGGCLASLALRATAAAYNNASQRAFVPRSSLPTILLPFFSVAGFVVSHALCHLPFYLPAIYLLPLPFRSTAY